MPTGYVYIIHAAGTNRIKIGHSADPAARVKELQTGSPFPLEVVGQWQGEPSDEAYLHRQYAACCVHLEWFEIPVGLAVMVVGQYFQMKARPPEPIPELPVWIADVVQIQTLAAITPISNENAALIKQSADRLMDVLEGRLSPDLRDRMIEVGRAMVMAIAA